MKKFFVLLLAIVFIAAGCKKSKQAEYTILGDYTPYGGMIEKMDGKVMKVVERMYWAVADKDTFMKGNLVTGKERDSLKWPYDFEVTFDSIGDLLNCKYLNENNKNVGSWQFLKEKKMFVSAKWTWLDTMKTNEKLGCNEKGIIISAEGYDPIKDTLMYKWTKSISKTGDTVEYLSYNSKGVFDSKIFDLFNDKGQYIGHESYNKEGVFDGSHVLTYGEIGPWSKWTNFDKDKKATRVYSRTYPEYDSRGNWIKAVTKDDKGHTVISERTYTYFH